MALKDIPDQQKVKKLLLKQLAQDRLSHAYLFLGPVGVGQKQLALTLAKTYFCKNKTEDCCDSCLNCQKINHDNHPDVDVIGLKEGKKQLGIDMIREMQRRLAYRPYEGGRRFFIIDNADQMTEEAANSLLKTLEEPPDYATLILIARDENKLLPTIISRCQKLRFSLLSDEILANYFKQNGIKTESLQILIQLAGGSLEKARNLIEKGEILEMRQELLAFLVELDKKSRVEVLEAAGRWAEWLEQDLPLFDLLIDWYRDIIVFEDTKKERLNNIDFYQDIQYFNQLYEKQELLKEIELINSFRQSIKANVKVELALQVLLLKIRTKRCKYEESNRSDISAGR
ncbi:MAG: DNA polymerase III subunit delta' [Bacillota bacterium]